MPGPDRERVTDTPPSDGQDRQPATSMNDDDQPTEADRRMRDALGPEMASDAVVVSV